MMFNSKASVARNETAVPIPMTSPRKLSHEAASIGQRIIDLEEELEATRERSMGFENRAKVAETMVEELRELIARERTKSDEQIAALTADRDHHKHHCSVIVTKLNTAGQIILDALREGNEAILRANPIVGAHPLANAHMSEKDRGIENAIAQVEQAITN